MTPVIIRVQGRAADWLSGRSPREQLLLGGFAALLLATLVYIAVWTPLRAVREAARSDIHAYETISARMKTAGPALGARPARRSGSPATIVTDTAAEAGLTVQRLEPEGALTRVAFEDAEFDKVMRWLDRIEAEGGLKVADLKLDRRPAPGTVNAQIALASR